MPELVEQMYCSQQIVIPPKFPYVLKKYAKAAIKTQPYDLLRWSHAYFQALAEGRTPPVKLRLEYPVYSTEGGLTRGYLKMLANQLVGNTELPLPMIKATWRGSCLDHAELIRIFCLCGVHMRESCVPFLHFIAVAAGLLTKSLTHTMILLCETLTKEPDGGSAAIPLDMFLTMYKYLARMDASKDTRYSNGYPEGVPIESESIVDEEEGLEEESEDAGEANSSVEEFWEPFGSDRLIKVALINDHLPQNGRLSQRMNLPVLSKLERSPSFEKASAIERENYMRERKGRPVPTEEADETLREMSRSKMQQETMEEKGVEKPKTEEKQEKIEKKGPNDIEIHILDEDEIELPLEIYGEKTFVTHEEDPDEDYPDEPPEVSPEEQEKEKEPVLDEKQLIMAYVEECYRQRDERLEDLEITFEDIAALVDRFKTANYDLSMVAGRQMSTTSGEFIVQHIEKEIMAFIDEQIAILPDPDLKKKKAKPEEVAMIRDLLEKFLDDNMEVIVPEIEEVEEEEAPIPEIVMVYAVPGIGPKVDEEIISEFVEYAHDVTKCQADVFMPRNIRHFLCPPLEKLPEQVYDVIDRKSEQVPTGGIITD